jgi:hypothetical protein
MRGAVCQVNYKIANRCPQAMDNTGAISTGGELVKRWCGVIGHRESATTECRRAAKDTMDRKGLAGK